MGFSNISHLFVKIGLRLLLLLVGWLVGWVGGWLVGWLVGWFVVVVVLKTAINLKQRRNFSECSSKAATERSFSIVVLSCSLLLVL